MSDPRPGSMYDPSDPKDNPQGAKSYKKNMKKKIAAKMAGNALDSVLGDPKYSFLRKAGKTIGFMANK